MSEGQKKPSIIDNALAEIAHIAFIEPAICTGWVLVAEWMGGNDDHWTITLADDENPEWRHLGLLHHGIKTWEDSDDVGYKDNSDKPTD